MSYYVFIYILSIILSLICGGLVFKRYRNFSGLSFFLFTFFTSIWTCFYFLFFSGIENISILLFLSRLDFVFSLGVTFSLVSFIYFFEKRTTENYSKRIFWIFIIYIGILIFYTSTNFIVSELSFSVKENVYREIPGKLYLVHILFQSIAIFLFGWFSILQFKKQTYLNKIRLKRILLSAFILVIFGFILQLILPALGIWILEKEIIFFYLAFVVYVFYILKRYYFSSLEYGIGKMFVAYLSGVISIVSINLIKYLYFNFKTGPINNYWMFQDQYSIIDTIVGIIIFYFSYKYLHKIFLGNRLILELKNKIHKLEQSISYIHDRKELNIFLGNEIKNIFKIQYCEMKIFSKDSKQTELQRYFENDLSDKIFINDVVFIEEKKIKFDKQCLFEEIPEEAFIILPIFNNQEKNIGAFIIGARSFGDFYTTEEIDVLRGFVSLLELHLKYIETYEKIQDLSINLDKKIDEKTMEYNDLINKQKEFISIISHEIKTPITTAIFQADSIIDDLEQGTISQKDIKNELELLSKQLIKTGELLSKIFSVQYFDTHQISLFKEKVQISYLLGSEYDVYSRMNEHVQFINRIDTTMGFIEIDKVQFQQVITNLLNNAIKFVNPKDPIIIVEAYKKDGWLYISIEDNGKGFEGIAMERLFEKYSIGDSGSAGLGMGLYLCKKIIEMHNGEIIASISKNLSGAQFIIKIPVAL